MALQPSCRGINGRTSPVTLPASTSTDRGGRGNLWYLARASWLAHSYGARGLEASPLRGTGVRPRGW